MSSKSIIYNVFNRIRSKISALNDDLHLSEPPLTPELPPAITRNRYAGGRSAVDFDLVEAVRLHDLGWSYRKIARQMNNVSRETVRTRILDYEAQFRVATSEPVQQPAPPAQQTPTASCKPSVAMPVAPKPALVPVVPAVVPRPTAPYGLDTVSPGTKQFFLVRGSLNQQYAHGYAQPAIGIETWRPEYATLPAFQAAEKIWVILNSSEDNRAFLLSLVADIRIRERCVLSVDNGSTIINQPIRLPDVWVQRVCKYHLIEKRTSPWSQIWSTFEMIYKFVPLPAPNCTEQLNALLAKPPEPEQPASLGGLTGPGYYGPL
jgi:hypothetical protein